MAQSSGSELGYNLDDLDCSVDLSGWTNGQDLESHQNRSDIFHEVIEKHCLDQLRTIVENGWDVNEELTGYDPHEPLLHAIIHSKNNQQASKMVQLLLEHGANANITHSVKIAGDGEVKWVQRTALHETLKLRWTEVVKMLLEAGAKCTTSDGLQNPLVMALQANDECQVNLIALLLKHGADPNDHDDQPKNIPLVAEIKLAAKNLWYLSEEDRLPICIIIQLLLDHGANPKVTYWEDIGQYGEVKWVQKTVLHEAASRSMREVVMMLLDAGATSDIVENPVAQQSYDCLRPDQIKWLLDKAADLQLKGTFKMFLLHKLIDYSCQLRSVQRPLELALDQVFLNGCDINMLDDAHRTALECAVEGDAHSNTIRWLIRHGADTALKHTLFQWIFMPCGSVSSLETPLILLQAGRRVAHGVQTQLSNIEVAISTWLQDTVDTADNYAYVYDEENVKATVWGIWDQLEKAEQEEPQRMQYNLKKCTFPEYWTRQMADLQEFSNESLQVYPEETHRRFAVGTRYGYEQLLDQIHRVQEFLSQPLSLQLHCRRFLRENLVSLQPSVVKNLPGPSSLKRYILCHEL